MRDSGASQGRKQLVWKGNRLMAGKGSGLRPRDWKKWCQGYDRIFGRGDNLPPPSKVHPDLKKDQNKGQCRRPIDRLPEGYDE